VKKVDLDSIYRYQCKKKINKREKSYLTRVREFLGGVQESGNKEFFSGKNLSFSEDGTIRLERKIIPRCDLSSSVGDSIKIVSGERQLIKP
jgi:hypothetical protein